MGYQSVIRGFFVVVFCLLFSACAHLGNSANRTVAKSAQTSFVLIQQVGVYQLEHCDQGAIRTCAPVGTPIKIFLGSGSGGVIDHLGPNTRVLTAKHVVAPAISHSKPAISGPLLRELIYRSSILANQHPSKIAELVREGTLQFSGKYFEFYTKFSDGTSDLAIGFRCDEKNDICVISTSKLHKEIPVIELAPKGPVLGDTVFCASAPFGNAVPGHAVPYFTGMYSGTDFETEKYPAYSWYTFPAAPGSSGSLILNQSGDLIGVLVGMSVGTFCSGQGCAPMTSGVTIAVPYTEVRNFLLNTSTVSNNNN